MDTNGIITTMAGSGSAAFAGDNGAATNASLNNPDGVTSDAAGDLYISDFNNNRIRLVDTNGIITTVAGNGLPGFAKDGYPATIFPNSAISGPAFVALGSAGVWYIADEYDDRIRKVDAEGIMTTVAGGGNSGDGGAATNANLFDPNSVALDAAGNMYIADQGNYRVRKVDTNGIITTVAGTGSHGYSGDGGAATNAQLWLPLGVCLDNLGDLYIADAGAHRVRRVDTNGIITTVAGTGSHGYSVDGGAATNAILYGPICVALDASGNLYIADANENRIRMVNFAGSPILTLNNVTATNAGNYSVVVSGSSGSVTSSVVTLTVAISPSIISPMLLSNGQFQFSFDSATNVDYEVQYSTNLTQWLPLTTLIGNGVPLTFIDTNSPTMQQSFYRIALSPP